MDSDTKTCQLCGSDYTNRRTESVTNWGRRMYCSQECSTASLRLSKARTEAKMQERAEANREHNAKALDAYLQRVRGSAQRQRQRRELQRLGAYR